MTRVVAPSRLHFGLLNIRNPLSGLRQFGGCGLMIADPGLAVQVDPAASWSASGPLAQRALEYAQQLLRALQHEQPLRITIERCPPEHVGLGVGTQLALATATAVQRELGLPALDASQLAEILQRGTRSAIGLHGFLEGGFLVDAGRLPSSGPAPLIGRYSFPAQWRIVLIRPGVDSPRWSGVKEASAFQQQQHHLDWNALTDQQCRWLVLGIIPALLARDFSAFSAALYEFNRLAGEQFLEQQGGVYSSPRLMDLVQRVRQLGIAGVGQSSWGPTLFAICEDANQADWLARQLHAEGDLEIVVTTVCETGYQIS